MLTMNYRNVCVEAFGYVVPQTVVTSEEIEQRLQPVYQRLKLPTGRLELMTGIRQRRFWPADTMVGDISAVSCDLALDVADADRNKVGLLVHASVCRDYLEPATACKVHRRLNLPKSCLTYDVSNACLGILNGILQAASMIELGHISSALVVGTENGRSLVDNTIDMLNTNDLLTRKSIKQSIASLTIGSASCAVLLTDRSISRTGNQLVNWCATADTQHHDLCESVRDQAGLMQPLMDTDSEMLMQQGVSTGKSTFERFLEQTEWTRDHIDHTFCHQVGAAHRKLFLDSIEMDPNKDFVTYPILGNTGSAALPITLAKAVEQDRLKAGDRIALLGIGSGINCVILGVRWTEGRVAGREMDRVDTLMAV